jgi:hypothetical protein
MNPAGTVAGRMKGRRGRGPPASRSPSRSWASRRPTTDVRPCAATTGSPTPLARGAGTSGQRLGRHRFDPRFIRSRAPRLPLTRNSASNSPIAKLRGLPTGDPFYMWPSSRPEPVCSFGASTTSRTRAWRRGLNSWPVYCHAARDTERPTAETVKRSRRSTMPSWSTPCST